MRAWPSPDVPQLEGARRAGPDAGNCAPIELYDRASDSLRPTSPTPGMPARLYVCGITPYDATHLGHAATYLTFDLLIRQWLDRGYPIRYTQNVTDVDDPLLERAAATGVDWRDLAERETQLFREDMTALRIIAPDAYVGAVESIDLVVELIGRLGPAVYRVEQDYYFDVAADTEFGSVSGLDAQSMLDLFAERGGDPDRPGKKDPLDCLLWQSARPGEPSWPSPLGEGRPGWHIECAAIALANLGCDFDVQGGGADLIFPHHEMSAAQARVGVGSEFAKAYVHTAMVGLHGEKMSKSKGNLVLVSQLRAEGVDPSAIRLALLSQHYRSDWQWDGSQIALAVQRLARWRAAVQRPTAAPAEPVIAQLRGALAQDLDAPGALAVMDAWCIAAGTAADPGPQVARAVDALLGVAL